MDDQIRHRMAQLRRIAEAEIARHRDRHGFRAAALDGSLATGAVWPSSDLDFTIVPLPGYLDNFWVEWGQTEGIPWHKHLTCRPTLEDLMARYPESFIEPARGRFNSDGNWMLDGLAVMEVVEDPEGLLAEVKAFVSARRFAGEIWEGRRDGFLAELRRLRDEARAALDKGEYEHLLAELSHAAGFAVTAGQVWLESARVIYSSKEQDGLLRQVAGERGCPEAHALYRRVCGADEARAGAAAPLIRRLGEDAALFLTRLSHRLPPESEHQRDTLLWAAWVSHLAHRMSLAPGMGHPAHLYQQMDRLRYEVQNRPRQWVRVAEMAELPGLDEMKAACDTLEQRLSEVEELLKCPLSHREQAELATESCSELLALTERYV